MIAYQTHITLLFFFALCCCCVSMKSVVTGFQVPLLNKVQKDYLALTRRVTARHILLPPKSEEVCILLKQKIRNVVENDNLYIVDAFEMAAKKYSRDDTTNEKGGLIGELVPQGYCRSIELDRIIFQSTRIGIIEGPVTTQYGTHLILVTERTNCPKLDGTTNTKLIRENVTSNKAILVPSTASGQEGGNVDISFILQQIILWIFVFFAGGIVAELVSFIS